MKEGEAQEAPPLPGGDVVELMVSEEREGVLFCAVATDQYPPHPGSCTLSLLTRGPSESTKDLNCSTMFPKKSTHGFPILSLSPRLGLKCSFG